MFHWEPERHYRHRVCMAVAPFWFSSDHLCKSLTPFWFSLKHLCKSLTPFWLSTYDISRCIKKYSVFVLAFYYKKLSKKPIFIIFEMTAFYYQKLILSLLESASFVFHSHFFNTAQMNVILAQVHYSFLGPTWVCIYSPTSVIRPHRDQRISG